MMRPAEKLQWLVDAYLNENARRPPTGIVMTERDYAELKDSLCQNLARELHYSPRFFHGIPLVASRAAKESKCLPAA